VLSGIPVTAAAADIAQNSALQAGLSGQGASRNHGWGNSNFQRLFQRRYHSISRQYHDFGGTIPPSIASPIADSKSSGTSSQISTVHDRFTQKRLEMRQEAQYQRGERRYQGDGLMLRIGLVLAMVYVGFLAVWIWATRLRAH
jgi:hypothetical protein